MADLGDLILEALGEEVVSGAEPGGSGRLDSAAIDQITDQLGGNAAAARAIVDAGGATSYSSAIRSVQRYRAPAGRESRNPTNARPATRAALGRVGRRAGTDWLRDGFTARIVGLVRVSEDLRWRTLTAHIPPGPEGADRIPPGPEGADRILAPYVRGDGAGAAAAFVRVFVANYGGVPIALEDTESVSLEVT